MGLQVACLTHFGRVGRSRRRSNVMLLILTSDLYNYLALAVMLLAILFGYRKGRDVVSVSSQSLAWTQVPLTAFAIASIGPSAFAIIIYLGYKFGLIQPEPSGYSFSRELPFDFAVINWGFVALYLTCRCGRISARPGLRCGFPWSRCPSQMFFCFTWLGRWFPTPSVLGKALRYRGHDPFANNHDYLAQHTS